MEPLILKNVSKKYKDFAFDNVSFSVSSGAIMGFVGENGAGKSTAINLILNLIKRDSGEIFVLGKESKTQLESAKENIGVVMDTCYFHDCLNAKSVNAILKSIYKTWNESKFKKYLKEFSLPENKTVKEYSKGMKMKLSIAAALSHDSKLLILDEATSGLDPIVRDEILDILLEFVENKTNSILISSHIISDLEKICNYITFIHKGKVIFTSQKDELLNSYGIIKCSEQDLVQISSEYIVGVRKGLVNSNNSNIEALVLKDKISKMLPEPEKIAIQKATIEEIMLYHIKKKV